MTYAAFEKLVTAKVEAALNAVGTEMVRAIQDDVPVADGRLRDSITFSTSSIKAKVGGNAKETDGVPDVTEPMVLYVGTRCPYAPAVEHGATPGTGRGAMDTQGTMYERIEAWLISRGFSATKEDVTRVMNNIRARGARENPFFWKNRARLEELGAQAMKKASSAIADKVPEPGKSKVIEITIPIRIM